jgi:hypothetical protein
MDIEITETEAFVLGVIAYVLVLHPDSPGAFFQDIAKENDEEYGDSHPKYSSSAVNNCLEFLLEKEILTKINSFLTEPENQNYTYLNQAISVTAWGFSFVLLNADRILRVVDEKNVPISDQAKGALRSLRAFRDGASPLHSAQNDNETVIHLDQENDLIKYVRKEVEETKRIIKNSNSIDSDKKQAYIESIDQGLSLLKKNKVMRAAVATLLLAPLYSAYSSIAEEHAKDAFESAIHLVRQLIGI